MIEAAGGADVGQVVASLDSEVVSAFEKLIEELRNPGAQFTRRGIADRVEEILGVFRRAWKATIADHKDKIEKLDEWIADLKQPRDLQDERYRTALAILEKDANVSEDDLDWVANQADPVKVLAGWRRKAS